MSGSLSEAFGDFTRAGIADVGDTYQEILMSHASTSEPQGLTGTYEQTMTEIDPTPQAETVEPGTVPNAIDNAAIPGLDIG